MNRLILTEFLDPERTHEHRLDPLLLDDFREVLVQRVHRNTQHLHALDALLVRDEAAELEPRRILRADVLRHPRAAGQGAVNQHPRRFPVDSRDVVGRLHDHPHHQHQHRRQHERRKDMHRPHRRHGHDPEMLENVIADDRESAGQCIGIHHLKQVHEPGKAHHPRIRPEHPRADHAQERVQKHRVQQRHPVALGHRTNPVQRPMHKRRREEHDHRVRQHDAPIREHPLVEVVAQEAGEPGGFFEGRHKVRN